ncbi:putative spermidine/putrescine ABC transporter,(ATP-binding protein) [Magnetospirillum sp. SS-4]|nr:putative spermidine/putrescine ABC transporter,(ATP-binding protein) [Magnetospirillum sp. SS-4]
MNKISTKPVPALCGPGPHCSFNPHGGCAADPDRMSPCPPGSACLIMDSVSCAYGENRVVDDVFFAVRPGELLCLLGPSGCGKTTTLRMAAGLEKPVEGRILLNGQLVGGQGVHVPPENRNVGFLFQDYALFPHLNILDNVAFGILNKPKAERRDRAIEMLRQVGMDKFADGWPHQLSGGQMQRVALARALAPQPMLMLLDEPFSGLDKRLRDQIRDETLHVLKSSGVCVLMVTHDPEEAMFMADRIAIMRGGRIIQIGEPEELYRRPASSFVASFFGEVNRLSVRVMDGEALSPFGSFPAPGFKDDEVVDLVIRPEAVSLELDDDGIATVLVSHMLGRSNLIHMRIDSDHAPPLHLHARTTGSLPHIEGARISVTIDRSQVHVYAREDQVDPDPVPEDVPAPPANVGNFC